MDVSTRNGAVAATAVFTALQVAATGLCVYLQSSRAAGYLRFYAVIPFGIYGGFSIQMSFKKRYGPDGATSRLGPVWVSQGIHGLVVCQCPRAHASWTWNASVRKRRCVDERN